MKYLRTPALLVGFSLLFVLSVFVQPAKAQSTEGLQIKPAVIEDKVNPGDVYHFSVTVMNVSDVQKTFFLSSRDISGLDDRGLPVFAPAGQTTQYELSSWVSIPVESVTLKAGETQTIPFSIKVPASASPGAHFGGVFLDAQPPQVKDNGAAIAYSVGSIISLNIAGDIREDTRIREFSTGKLVYGVANIDFNSKIENMGNILVRPHGVVTISNMFGKTVGTVSINDSAAPVFPGSVRVYTTHWKSDSFAFGRFEAIAGFSYGDQEKKTISATTSFWVLPLKPILIIGGSLLGIVLLLYIAIKSYIKRKLRQMGVSGSRTDVNFYAQKYQQSGSRLVVFTLVVCLICVIFLGLLFMIFA